MMLSQTQQEVKMIAYTLKEIIVNFLQRDYSFTEAEARAELEVLFINNRPVTRDYYLTVRRTGLKVIGGRAVRASIYETFKNSQNHASFAV